MATTDLYSQVSYVSDGVATTYSIPFPYFDPEHIHVLDNGEEISNYSFLSEGVINLDNPAPLDNTISIYRETPRDRIIDFTDGSILNSETLDRDSNQMMFIVQEATDRMVNLITLDTDDAFDGKTKRIKNVGDAVEETDVMNMRSAIEYLQQTQQARDEAIEARDTTVDASSYAITAKKYATENEDVEVETGEYSAKHWALKAEETASSVTGMSVHGNEWHDKDFATSEEVDTLLSKLFDVRITEDIYDFGRTYGDLFKFINTLPNNQGNLVLNDGGFDFSSLGENKVYYEFSDNTLDIKAVAPSYSNDKLFVITNNPTEIQVFNLTEPWFESTTSPTAPDNTISFSSYVIKDIEFISDQEIVVLSDTELNKYTLTNPNDLSDLDSLTPTETYNLSLTNPVSLQYVLDGGGMGYYLVEDRGTNNIEIYENYSADLADLMVTTTHSVTEGDLRGFHAYNNGYNIIYGVATTGGDFTLYEIEYTERDFYMSPYQINMWDKGSYFNDEGFILNSDGTRNLKYANLYTDYTIPPRFSVATVGNPRVVGRCEVSFDTYNKPKESWDTIAYALNEVGEYGSVDILQYEDNPEAPSPWELENLKEPLGFKQIDLSSQYQISPDGLKIYDEGKVFNLTTPWDITTIQEPAQAINPTLLGGETIKSSYLTPDGTKLFIVFNIVNQYPIECFTLNTPWDITTAISTGNRIENTNEDSEGGIYWSHGRNLKISNDGSHLIVLTVGGAGSSSILEFNFGTPYDLTTLDLTQNIGDGKIFKPSVESRIDLSEFSSNTIVLDETNSKIYVVYEYYYEVGSSDWYMEVLDLVEEGNFNSSLPIQGIPAGNYGLSFSNGVNESPYSLNFSPDGTRAYITTTDDNYNKRIYQYDLKGSHWFTTMRDVPSNLDISSLDPQKPLRLNLNLWRKDATNKPTFEYVARRYTI